jgi:hypothetical protein
MTEPITRRRLLKLAGASAAGAAVVGFGGRAALAGADWGLSSGPVPWSERQHFVTRPDVQPPKITVTRYGPVSPSRYIFLDSPASGPGVGGAVIIDAAGELVWFGPDTTSEHKLDFNVQTLNGEPVLTWWQGIVVDGHGEGEAVIADSTYTVQNVIPAQNGLQADLHEFLITPRNTALISAYNRHSGVDLSGVDNGPADGYIYSGVFQEIDIATGDLLFEWDSYPAVPVTDSYKPLGTSGTQAEPFDYFHINSIDTDSSGDFLVSSRHTWTIFRISKTDGSIVWQMNGKHSDFTIGKDAGFAYQHHVRPDGPGQLTLFDNAAAVRKTRSRALILSYDTTTMQVELVKAFVHPGEVRAAAMGSAEILPGNEMFVGWGTAARFSQFSAAGQLLLDGVLVRNAASYRAFSKEWKGQPATLPVAAAHPAKGGATVYASWNGATEVATWTVLAGKTATSLARVVGVKRTGFETKIAVPNAGPYFAVRANDSAGHALATSETVSIS